MLNHADIIRNQVVLQAKAFYSAESHLLKGCLLESYEILRQEHHCSTGAVYCSLSQ